MREALVKFAKFVFWIAGIWGMLVLTPLFFLFDLIGRKDPPAITHPGFYYGFVMVALTWQIAFMFIATDPVRFRTMMIPAMLEKFTYVVTVLVLYLQGRMHGSDLVLDSGDLVMGILFVIAYLKTKQAALAVGQPAQAVSS
jgi:hypothetical protein